MFRIKYLFSIALSKLSFFKKNEYDLVVVSPPNYEDWILGSIAHRVADSYKGKVHFSNTLSKLPSSKAYFFIHHPLLRTAYTLNPILWKSTVSVWFTHDDKFPFSKSEMRFLLGNVDKIFTPSTVSKNSIVSEYGASKDKIVLSIGAADPNIYLPHKRSSGVIGLVSRFSERKNPKLILQIVKKMPDVNFLLIGTRWEKSDVFDSLMSYDNFSYVDPNYEDYHSYHSNIDVYLSTSFIEGGPIPLIETMMSNIVPVVSNTGFASDVIVDGENGFLFDVYDDVDVIVRKLNSALDFDKDVSWSVEGFTWDAFVNNIQLNLDR